MIMIIKIWCFDINNEKNYHKKNMSVPGVKARPSTAPGLGVDKVESD